VKLTSLERKVLWGLTCHPEMSLKALSRELELNYWSIYKIREKFRREGLIKEVLIPNYRALGFELLVAGYGSITREKLQYISSLEKAIKNNCEICESGMFFAFTESYRGFTLGVMKNYTQLVKNLLYMDRITGLREIMRRETPKLILLPLEITQLPIFFDYSNLISREFGFPTCSRRRILNPSGTLSRNEIIIMKELVQKPAITLKSLSEKVNMSREKVRKIREKLLNKGWCIPRVIPDMRALGYEVIVFAHWESNPMGIIKIERNIKNLDIDLSRVIFLAYNPLEGIVIALFKSLGESREIISLFSKFVERENVLIREPDILFLSLEEGKEIKSHEHHPILSSLL